MRRPVRLALGVLTAAGLVLAPSMAGTSAAAPSKGAAASASAKKPAKPAKPAPKPAKPAPKPAKQKNAKAKVVVVGVVTATQTVTTAGSDTSTVRLVVRIQGGDKEYKGLTRPVLVTKDTVVKRNHGRKTRYDVQVGDKVTVHARRAEDRSLTAFYVAASGRPAPQPVATSPSSTNTATTTATTEPSSTGTATTQP